MKRSIFYLLVILLASGATILAQRNKSTQRQPTTSIPAVHASKVRPPLLNFTKIKNPHVPYVPIFQLKKYPIPAVLFMREGLANAEDRREIKEKIIYPAINKSDKPIAAIVVELYRDRTEIGVTLMWHEAGSSGDSVEFASALISRNKTGHFDLDAYLRLFPDEDD